jgi:hypothetical protein
MLPLWYNRVTIQLFPKFVQDHVLITIVSQKGVARRDAEPGDVTAASGARIAGSHPRNPAVNSACAR